MIVIVVDASYRRAVHIVGGQISASVAAPCAHDQISASVAAPTCAHDLLQWWGPGRGVLAGRCSVPCVHGVVMATSDFGGLLDGALVVDVAGPATAAPRQPTDPA